MTRGLTARPYRPAHSHPARPEPPSSSRSRNRRWSPGNVPAGVGAAIWLVIVAVPLYFIVITSLRTQDDYLNEGALTPPADITLSNYGRMFDLGFGTALLNSAIVTVATVLLVLGLALPAAYAIVRSRSRWIRPLLTVFLLGLAIPAQAVIIPIYLIITRLYLYDSLLAIILPTAAFSLPMAIVVLTSTLRDIPSDLYAAMAVDGASAAKTFGLMVIPCARPGLVTAGIFSGLNAWNGFIFPLVLTQSDNRRVVPLSLYQFQNQYGTDVPGLLAAVVISTVPVLALYLFGRARLVHGLQAGYR